MIKKNHKKVEEFLKMGIKTRNMTYNSMINSLADIVCRSRDTILLCGAPGTGKTSLICRLYQCIHQEQSGFGPLVRLNCAAFEEREIMTALFGGHDSQGKFCPGALAEAAGGMLFLDRAEYLPPEGKRRLLEVVETDPDGPPGSAKKSPCDFLLASAVNTDNGLSYDDESADFLSRIGLWHFSLPSLRERPEDIKPNLEYELKEQQRKTSALCVFEPEALNEYLTFALSPQALWRGNFRDLNQSVRRMAFLSDGGNITAAIVHEEKEQLLDRWYNDTNENTGAFHASVDTDSPTLPLPEASSADATPLCGSIQFTPSIEENLSPELTKTLEACDEFDRVQLLAVLNICRTSGTMAAAGRKLFAMSRTERVSVNDSDRLKKYLARFELTWEMVKG